MVALCQHDVAAWEHAHLEVGVRSAPESALAAGHVVAALSAHGGLAAKALGSKDERARLGDAWVCKGSARGMRSPRRLSGKYIVAQSGHDTNGSFDRGYCLPLNGQTSSILDRESTGLSRAARSSSEQGVQDSFRLVCTELPREGILLM